MPASRTSFSLTTANDIAAVYMVYMVVKQHAASCLHSTFMLLVQGNGRYQHTTNLYFSLGTLHKIYVYKATIIPQL
jgi:hypothetical protein